MQEAERVTGSSGEVRRACARPAARRSASRRVASVEAAYAYARDDQCRLCALMPAHRLQRPPALLRQRQRAPRAASAACVPPL